MCPHRHSVCAAVAHALKPEDLRSLNLTGRIWSRYTERDGREVVHFQPGPLVGALSTSQA